MQKLYFKNLLVMIMLTSAVWGNVCGQSTANYTFTTNTTGSLALDMNGNNVDMTTGTTSLYGVNTDSYTATLQNLTFSFNFMGSIYTQFSANPDGQVRLGGTAISGHTQSASSGVPYIVVCNIDNKTSSTTGSVSYKVQAGTSGKVLIIEWKDVLINYLASGTTLSTFQLRLYENTGVIEMVYGQMWNSSTSAQTSAIGFSSSNAAASIGQITTITGTPTYNSSNTSYTTTSFAASSAMTNLNSASNGSRRVFRFTPPMAPNDPSALNFTSIGLASMTLNWTDASNEIGYQIERSTDGGVTWTFVTSLAANTILYNATGLLPGTSYMWRIKSLSEGTFSTGITGTQATTSCPTFASTIAIGGATVVGSSYPTLTAAITDLKTCGITQPVILELSSSYTSGSETFPIVLDSIPGSSSTNTITIREASGVTGKSITSTNTTATVDINKGDFWIIDGRPGGTGSRDLALGNTGAAPAVRFVNDAQNNTLRYCTVTSTVTSTTSGLVLFSTTTGSSGNDNNTVDNCDLNGGGTAANVIYASGTTTTTATNNSNVTISNNLIRDQFVAGSATNGILVSSGNTDWTISGNSFYQTATRTFTTGSSHVGINISNSSGNNFTITNNFIGGSAVSCGGTAWTIAGSVTNRFRGISLSVGSTTASSIQGNTIANFNFSTSSGASTVGGLWCGIYMNAGNANIGTTTGNTIGAATGTSSVKSTSSVSGGISTGIFVETTTGTVVISNNTIGSIETVGAASVSHGFTGISTAAVTNLTISNNTIGSTATSNSINASFANTNAAVSVVTGIRNTATGVVNIKNNIIANLNSASTPSSNTGNIITGITSSAGTDTISGNTIRNLTCAGIATGTTSSAGIIGISMTSATASAIVSQNTIYSLNNTNSSANVTSIIGIHYNGSTTGTNEVSRNLIHSFQTSAGSTSSTTGFRGINVSGGATTYKNNMIRLGYNGTGFTTGHAIHGISDAIGTNNYFNNTVFLGGTTNVGGSMNTFAFNSAVTTNTRLFQNNIFINNLNNSTGTGKHYAITVAGTAANPSGLTSNNNVYFASGTGGVLGLFNSIDQTTIAAWRTATGQDAVSFNNDPQLLSPTASIPDLHINTAVATVVEGTGTAIASVTDDYDGDTRSGLTPVDIGADAGNFIAAAPIFANMVSSPALTTQCTKVARAISIDITTSAGTIAGATLNYSHNGTAQTAITMTNSAGNTWTGTMLAPATGNATVTWSITASNSLGISSSYSGTSYADEPNTGITATASATATSACVGSPDTLSAVISRSGSVTLGAGASTSSLAGISPYYHGYGGVKSQYIVKASELSALGLTTGNITALATNITTLGTTTLSQFTISLGHTTQSAAVAGAAIVSGLTQVYSNASQTLTTGSNSYTFSTPFNWNGTDNLVVTFCYTNNNTGGTSSTVSVDATSPSFVSSLAIYADNVSNASTCLIPATTSGQACMGTNSNTTTSTRPRFVFTGNTAPTPTSHNWVQNSTSVVSTAHPYTFSVVSGTNGYKDSVIVNSCPVVSNSVTVSGNPIPTAPTTTNSVQCGPGAPTDSVTDPNGFTNPIFNWYSASTGGTLLQSSTSKKYTSTISTTTILFVSVVNPSTGCESVRTPDTVTVTSSDTVGITSLPSSLSSICLGSSFSLTPVQPGTTNTYALTWASAGAGSGLTSSTGGTLNTALTITPTAAGTYTYIINGIETGTGCTAMKSISATVVNPNAGITATATATSTSACVGSPDTLRVVLSKSGNATIGNTSGTAISTTGTPYRTGTTVGNQIRNQYLILASELSAAGITAGNINSVGINVSTVSPTGTMTSFSIGMANVSATALTSTLLTNSLTTVFSTASYSPITGVNTHTFTTPFSWDGSSNVLLDIRGVLGTSGSGTSLVTSTTPSSIIACVQTNSTTGFTDATGTTLTNQRPQFTFNANTAPTPTSHNWVQNSTSVVSTAHPYTFSVVSGTNGYKDSVIVNSCPVVSNTVTVDNNVAPFAFTAVSSSKGASFCVSDAPTSLSTNASGGCVPYTYNWSGPGGAAGSSATLAASAAGTYNVTVTDNAGTSITQSIVLTVNNPTPTVTPQTKCSAASTTFTLGAAVSTSGDSLYWYTDSLGNSQVSSGTSYTTPSISTTTKYFVSEWQPSTTLTSLGNTSIPSTTLVSAERGIVIRATSSFRLISAQYYSTVTSTSGSVTIRLVDSATGTQIYTKTINMTHGASSAWYTMNIDWNIPVGSYRLLAAFSTISVSRHGTGVVTYPFALGSVGQIVTGYDGAVNTSYNYFHNLSIQTGCAGTRVPVTATLNTPPALAIDSPNFSVCKGSTSAAVSATAATVGNYTTYSWTPTTGVNSPNASGTTFTPSSTTTYTLSGTDGTCSRTASITITAADTPSRLTLSQGTSKIHCSQRIDSLMVSGGVSNGSIIHAENFNGTNSWTTVNSTTGGTPSSTAWTLRPNGYVYSTYATWNSNDNSQFYLSNSDAGGSGNNTLTMLQSPSFSTLNYSNISLKFYSYLYDATPSSTTAKVQASLNGSTWADIQTLTPSSSNASTNFTLSTVNLPSQYSNQSTVYIRFSYSGTYRYFWGIDNVTISGDFLSITWSPTSGLFTNSGATASYTSGHASKLYTKNTSTTKYYAQSQLGNCIVRDSIIDSVNTATNMVTLVSASSSGAVAQCTDAGWTYYGTASNPDKLLFAINKSSATGLTGETVSIMVDGTNFSSNSSNGANQEHASFFMKRGWDVTAPVFTGSAIVRFYYDPTDSSTTVAARDADSIAKKAANPSSHLRNSPFTWFKSKNTSYTSWRTASVRGNQFTAGTYDILTPTYGTQNGINYVEFTVSSFSGGSGGAGFGPGGSGGTGGGVGLPVTWAGFDVKSEEAGNMLTWKTASEKNTDYFEVEYSYDARQWLVISEKIAAAGNSADLRTYHYTHADFAPFIYYRIKQVDLDGPFDYSSIKLAKRIAGPSFVVSVFPIPMEDDHIVNVSVKGVDKSLMHITLTDITGKTIRDTHLTPSSENVKESFDMSPLAPGIYFIEVQNGQGKETIKVSR